METIEINFPLNIVKMSKNSLCFEQKRRLVWIHRNVLNKLLQSEEKPPTFVMRKTLKCGDMWWVAIPSTL